MQSQVLMVFKNVSEKLVGVFLWQSWLPRLAVLCVGNHYRVWYHDEQKRLTHAYACVFVCVSVVG